MIVLIITTRFNDEVSWAFRIFDIDNSGSIAVEEINDSVQVDNWMMMMMVLSLMMTKTTKTSVKGYALWWVAWDALSFSDTIVVILSGFADMDALGWLKIATFGYGWVVRVMQHNVESSSVRQVYPRQRQSHWGHLSRQMSSMALSLSWIHWSDGWRLAMTNIRSR